MLESTPNLTIKASKRGRSLLGLICVLVTCVILTLGLWPFHAPRNGVTWMSNRDGLSFGRYSSVVSPGTFSLASGTEASLEICLQPYSLWDSGTLLVFYRPRNSIRFSLKQIQSDLMVRYSSEDQQHHPRTANLYIRGVFLKPGPTFITITSGTRGASIYIDGTLAASQLRFPLFAEDFNGRLVLGDSTGQPDSWKGQLFGLAIYGRQVEATQAFHHYAIWKDTLRLEPSPNERNIALYIFDERTGNVVRDKAHSGAELYIPERYQVIDKIVLEPFWAEFSMTRSYWGAVTKNIIGFIPFGISIYAYLSAALSRRRALLLTITLGAAASFTIELLQGFLPTRDSGTTDLITNTLGTWIGVASYRLVSPVLGKMVPWLPMGVARR